MSFSERAKITALAIVKIFETSKPFGDYSAVAVLADGAGISYGISQFTHRSGSLAAVVSAYLKFGGKLHADNLRGFIVQLKDENSVNKLARNAELKKMLREAGETPEMQAAQRSVMISNYLNPAITAAEGSHFVLPLSLAAIYDSKNQGSYDKIRDRNSQKRERFATDLEFEKAWITEYVRDRDSWLENFTSADKKKQELLRKTDYRTDFFLAQIGRGNWQLNLPMHVHGHLLTESILFGKNAPKMFGETIAVKSALPSLEELIEMPGEAAKEAEDAVRQAADETMRRAQELAAEADRQARLQAEDAARKLPDTTISGIKTFFLQKLWKFAAGISVGTYLIPQFVQDLFSDSQTIAQFASLLKTAFPYLFAAGVLGLIVWFVVTKAEHFLLQREKIRANTDTLRGNVVVTPAQAPAPENTNIVRTFLHL